MLTKLTIRNFKRLRDVEIPLDEAVVFIGPNNSGKTTALQALALWEIGLRAWLAERGDKASPEKRPGVAINRRDLIALPVPTANLLWSDLHVRETKERKTRNIRMEIIVEGRIDREHWICGFEFDYTSTEALICRPVRKSGQDHKPVQETDFTEIPAVLHAPERRMRICFLPPMSGLAAVEPKIEPGRIDVLLGEGQTAQVLRNLCHQAASRDPEAWARICARMKDWFGCQLNTPEYNAQRGEIILSYQQGTSTLDISSSGRGAQQSLLLLAYLEANPGTVLLLDEPDAHLEILRQRQIYNEVVDIARRQKTQIIAASHSEVVLNEAAGRDIVVAFVGRPHVLANGKSTQAIKALREIGFEHYYQAEQMGWVLYLEDSTDLPILQAFARKLNHPAAAGLATPYVHYLGTNLPQRAREHYRGLQEAKPDLVGLALFDRLKSGLQPTQDLVEVMWKKREIENYFCQREVLLRYAATITHPAGLLFDFGQEPQRVAVMAEQIDQLAAALALFNRPGPWSEDIKATDDFLDPLFKNLSAALGLPLLLRKSEYADLVEFLEPGEIDPEVIEKLDAIANVARRAVPAGG